MALPPAALYGQYGLANASDVPVRPPSPLPLEDLGLASHEQAQNRRAVDSVTSLPHAAVFRHIIAFEQRPVERFGSVAKKRIVLIDERFHCPVAIRSGHLGERRL